MPQIQELPASMTSPECEPCKTNFINMQELSLHMKMTHGETDSMRLERYERLMLQGSVSTPTIESNGKKIFDCSECGLFFQN